MNAGATFRRAMDITFKGLINKNVVVYLDDINLYSKRRNNHLHDLKQIFEIFKRYRISLNPKKSFFALSEGKLLRFIVSKNGICITDLRALQPRALLLLRALDPSACLRLAALLLGSLPLLLVPSFTLGPPARFPWGPAALPSLSLSLECPLRF